jgi:hypothetical protein
MFSVYRSLLYLYPVAHRREYGEEMLAVFLDAQADTRTKNILHTGRFWIREVQGLLGGALQEHFCSLMGSSYPVVSFPRRPIMRSEFRFPKATATLMTIILAGVVMAIEKATAIVNSVPHTGPHVGPIQAAHFTLFPTLLVILAFGCVAGAIGWAIAFALHRSGMQRLADFNPSGQQPSAGR